MSAPIAPVDPANPVEPSKFDLLVKQNELTQTVASQLFHVLSNCEVCLLCDDSGSMGNTILEPGSNKQTTRWMELKQLAAVVIEFVTAINPNGLDIYFFNRPILRNVVDMSGLQQTFSNPPNGGTPLIGTLKKIYRDKANLPGERQLLIVVITDGESSDGNEEDLFYTLVNKPNNVHVSMAECTDNEEEMEYLDRFNGRVKNFDNTDDYREELAKVKRIQGPNYKFDRVDYTIKILLASFLKWYFQLDQTQVTNRTTAYTQDPRYKQDDCCVIL